MYDLSQLTAADLDQIQQHFLNSSSKDAKSLESLADTFIRACYTAFRDPRTDTPACALIRCYITQPTTKLEPRLQALVRTTAGDSVHLPSRCLTLLASAGDRSEWNDRTQSIGHQVIPLSSETIVQQSPMIARMLQEFGLKLNALITGDAAALHLMEKRMHNVFYVADAEGSPYIPAQADFVRVYQIKSVLGIGGVLPYGNIFAIIMFSKVAIPPAAVPLFAAFAIQVKKAFVPVAQRRVWT